MDPIRPLRYLAHQWNAQDSYTVHSPFVFNFHQFVLKHRSSQMGTRIAQFRDSLRNSTESIRYKDLGAKGGEEVYKTATLGELVQRVSRRQREGEFLYRLCNYYQPRHCLELGTHLGFSSLYQLAALPCSEFITIEGAESLAQLASKHFKHFGFSPKQLIGDFSKHLSHTIDLDKYRPDYVFIDGNHRYDATMEYFHTLLPVMNEGGMMVFDDINWSADMQRAWEEICQHPEVSVSIDLFCMGVCFIRRKQAKSHFRFRFRNFSVWGK